jgi:hypothetical protein
MTPHSEDAAHCSNGLTAQKFRGSTKEEQAAYRRWLRGIIFFYCGLLFISGVAVVTYSGTGHTQLSNLSAQQIAKSTRAD